MKYVKKPIEVEAVQWAEDISNSEEIKEFLGDSFIGFVVDDSTYIVMGTTNGTYTCTPGDYIVKGHDGEFYPNKPYVFHKLHEPVKKEELPKLYLCDRRACEKCNPECHHTADISHAKNFELSNDTLFEKEKNPIVLKVNASLKSGVLHKIHETLTKQMADGVILCPSYLELIQLEEGGIIYDVTVTARKSELRGKTAEMVIIEDISNMAGPSISPDEIRESLDLQDSVYRFVDKHLENIVKESRREKN